MKNDEAILAKLEALETRVAALEARPGSFDVPALRRALIEHERAPRALALAFEQVSTKRRDEGTSICYPQESPAGTAPTEGEHKKLLAIVFRKFPKLKPDENHEAEFWRDYGRSFEALRCIGRAEKPDSGKYVSWWIDECRTLLGANVRGVAFIAAALAHGDIPYVAGSEHEGIVWELGLKVYGAGRRPSGDAWRSVLTTGELLPPSQPARPAPQRRHTEIRVFE